MAEETFIPWSGGDCPEAPISQIKPVYRGGYDPKRGTRIVCAPAVRLDWSHDGSDDDIIGYYVLHDGREAWEWAKRRAAELNLP